MNSKHPVTSHFIVAFLGTDDTGISTSFDVFWYIELYYATDKNVSTSAKTQKMEIGFENKLHNYKSVDFSIIDDWF